MPTFALCAWQLECRAVCRALVFVVIKIQRLKRTSVGHVAVGQLVEHTVQRPVMRQLKPAQQQARADLPAAAHHTRGTCIDG